MTVLAATAAAITWAVLAVAVLVALALVVVGAVETRPIPVPPPASPGGQVWAAGRARVIEPPTAEYATYGRHAEKEGTPCER